VTVNVPLTVSAGQAATVQKPTEQKSLLNQG
jgi:hypothetical protein